jgi:hypothetical protein
MSEAIDTGAPASAPNFEGNTLADGNAKTAGPPPSAPRLSELPRDLGPIDLDKPLEQEIERARGEGLAREVLDLAEKPRPPDMPRSWATEDADTWAKLPPDLRAKIAEREQGREREFRKGQDAIARARKEAEAAQRERSRGDTGLDAIRISMAALAPELQAYGEGTPQEVYARLQQESPERAAEFAEKYRRFDVLHSHAVMEHRQRLLEAGRGQEVLEQMVGELKAAFPEVKNIADAQKLARDNPERYQQWTAAMQQLNAAQSHVRAVESQHQEAAQTQFREYADAEDAKFQAAIPEYNDPARYEALQDAALDALIDDYGFDQRELAQAWNTNPLLRDHRVQKMFAELGRMRLARARAAEARPKMPPKPQAPGSYRESNEGGSLEAMAKAGNMKAYIEARRRGAVR